MLQRGDEDLQLGVLQPQDQQQQVDVEKYLLSGHGDKVRFNKRVLRKQWTRNLNTGVTSQPGNFCSSQCIRDRPKIKTNNQN